jgi:hypothetical protein
MPANQRLLPRASPRRRDCLPTSGSLIPFTDMSATVDLRPDELMAAEVLRDQLGGEIRPMDVGRAQAMHEFNLIQPDEHRRRGHDCD